jgi:hypothetical protein
MNKFEQMIWTGWGWGMCEPQEGTYDFTEFEKQYSAVTTNTQIKVMPILLRYYNFVEFSFPPFNYSEQLWAGPLTGGPRGIQVYVRTKNGLHRELRPS